MNRTKRTLRLLDNFNVGIDSVILDAGCGFGETLQGLRTAGYKNLRGVDPNKEAVRSVAQNGFLVEHGTVNEKTIEADQYGVILLLDVLEHVVRGTEADVVSVLVKGLRPGGILIISVPYCGLTAWLDPANLKKIVTFNRWTPWHRHYSVRSIKSLVPENATVVRYDRFGLGLSQLFRIVSAPVRWIWGEGKFLKSQQQVSSFDAGITSRLFAYHVMVVIQKK